MVTSISVALIKNEGQYGLPTPNESFYIMAHTGGIRRVADAVIVGAREGEDVPEGAQQPVIDDLEEACHGDGCLMFSETTETMGSGFSGCVSCCPVVADSPRWLLWPGPWLSLRTGGKRASGRRGLCRCCRSPVGVKNCRYGV